MVHRDGKKIGFQVTGGMGTKHVDSGIFFWGDESVLELDGYMTL